MRSAHEQKQIETEPAVGEQIRRRIERLAFQANHTLKSPSPDAVHDLRVAIRRAEQGLLTYKSDLPRKPLKRIRKQLKDVLSAAGALRDLDVAIKILLKKEQPGAAELRREIRGRRKAAERELLARLKRLSLRTRIGKWCADLDLNRPEAEYKTGLDGLGKNVLPKLAARFFEAGDSAASHKSSEKLHEFRIRAKKFRYTLELFVPVYGPPAEEWIGQIKSVQTILGAVNDYRNLQTLAAEFEAGKKLTAALNRSERRKIREFRETWKDQFAGNSAQWVRALRAPREELRVARKPIASTNTHGQETVAVRA